MAEQIRENHTIRETENKNDAPSKRTVPLLNPGTIELVKRLGIYFLGNFILAMGIAFTVKSDLGLSPLNTLPYVLSRVLHADFGLMVTVFYSSLVLIQILILRRNFRVKELLQIGIALLFGFFVSLSENILSGLMPRTYFLKFFFMAIGQCLIALGIMMYLTPELMNQPPEGLTLALQRVTGRKFSNIKTVFDCTVLISALLLALLTNTDFSGIREGTLISALVLGKLIALMAHLMQKRILKFCYRDRKSEYSSLQ